jgi:hypothetical protein
MSGDIREITGGIRVPLRIEVMPALLVELRTSCSDQIFTKDRRHSCWPWRKDLRNLSAIGPPGGRASQARALDGARPPSLHRHPAPRPVGDEAQQLRSRELLAQHQFSVRVAVMKAKHVLCRSIPKIVRWIFALSLLGLTEVETYQGKKHRDAQPSSAITHIEDWDLFRRNWESYPMIINITTIATRKKRYIDKTLESLSKSDGAEFPVNLILGSEDTSHIEQYQSVANLVLWDKASQAISREGHLRHNCNVNAIRSLKYGEDDHCVCCEDDVLFNEHWYSDLIEIIAEIRPNNYVLNMGQGSVKSSDRRHVVHSGRFLSGAQSIFYPNKIFRDRIARYLERNISRGLNDYLIGKYAKDFAALYNTVPRLISHIGRVSNFY